MPTIYIDNQKIEAENGESVIAAAHRNNINIAHFCWHPELSVGGNCRMCLVEVGSPKRNPDGSFALDENNEKIINYMPKLQIACNTIVSDEMRVNINSQKCIDARASVMEFLLINHPLDCPICDEAGNCKLQNYSYNYSKGESRFIEEKNKNPKRVIWNDKIIYDAERCIACSRCGRVTREVCKEDVLTMVNRGDKVRVECINPDAKDNNKITNNYSMNIIDTCPVGALTSKDFRFKSRVWDMSFNDSICIGCSRGCNISVGIKNNEILRVSPVQNIYVNKSWMCNDGRFETAKLVNENRTTSLKIRNINIKTTLENAINEAAKILNKSTANDTYFIASPFASNESNYLLSLLSKHISKGKTNNIGYIPRINNNFEDNILRTKNKAPNINFLKTLDIEITDISSLVTKIKNNSIKTLFVIEEDLSGAAELTEVLGKVENLIVCSFNENLAFTLADIAFPVATFAEYEGTFTNCDNRVQHFKPIIAYSQEEALKNGIEQSRLDIFAAQNDNWSHKIIRNIKPTWWILNELIKRTKNDELKIKNAEDIFSQISKNIKDFAGMSYELLVQHQGLVLGNANNPDPIVNKYHSYVRS